MDLAKTLRLIELIGYYAVSWAERGGFDGESGCDQLVVSAHQHESASIAKLLTNICKHVHTRD